VIPATGVVLAGGLSRRLGIDKTGIMVAGETLLARSIRRMAGLFPDVIVVGGPNLAERPDWIHAPSVRLTGDRLPGHGPLGGIHAALCAASRDRIFVTACDMPFRDEPVARLLVAASLGHDAAVPAIGAFTEPLLACYAQSCLSVIEEQLNQDRNQVQGLFDRLDVRFVTEAERRAVCEPERTFFNINSADDLACFLTGANGGDMLR